MRNEVGKKGGLRMDFLFSMLLLLVFVLSSVFVVLIGSQVYSNIQKRNTASFQTDTALSYLSNKVRQADGSDDIAVEVMGDQSILVLSSEVDGVVYETRLYTKDGSIRELFTMQGSELSLEDGIAVMDCEEVSFDLTEGKYREKLTISLGGDAGETKATLSLRSQKGGRT